MLFGITTGNSSMQITQAGNVFVSNSTNSTNSSTGGLTVAGGIGVSGNIIIGNSNLTTGPNSTNGNIFSVGNTVSNNWTDNVTGSSGNVSNWIQSYFASYTLNSVNTNVITTSASTVFIAGSPIAGTNETITNSYSLYINSGNNYLGVGITKAGSLSTNAFLITGSTSGTITISGQSNSGTYNFNLPTTAGTTGQVLVSQGGTGAMTWANSGTVTSVGLTVPSFLSITGSPITTNGTFAVGYSGIALPVVNGGTGTTTSSGTGSVILQTSPTLITPIIGVATGSSLSLSSSTLSGSSITGSFNTLGGIGISGNLFMGSNITTTPTASVGSYININASTFTNNSSVTTLANWSEIYVGQTTLARTVTGTTTNGYSLFIAGSPIAGSNNTITNSYSLYIGSGNNYLGTGITTCNTISSQSILLNGSVSGSISLNSQSNSGTYNFNLPTTAGSAGQVLVSQGGSGIAMTWANLITSIGMTVPSFLSVTGSPITSNGTFAIGYSGTALPIANGGTGTTTSSGTGSNILQTSPTLITPNIGVATGTSIVASGDITANTVSINNGTGLVVINSSSGSYNLNLPTTAGTAGQVLTSQNGTADMTWTTLLTNTVLSKWIISERYVSGTNAGTFTNGAFRIRTLNTIVSSSADTSVTLASNVMTFTPGNYYIEISVPSYKCGSVLATLNNSSNSAVIATSTSANSHITSPSTVYNIITTFLNVTVTTGYNVQHRCTTTTATNGFGIATGFGVETYTTVSITQIL
jgi:hypothetical protein